MYLVNSLNFCLGSKLGLEFEIYRSIIFPINPIISTTIHERRKIIMALTNEYLAGVYEDVKKRNPGESEFLQAVYEVLDSLQPIAEKRKDFVDAGVFERIVEPER